MFTEFFSYWWLLLTLPLLIWGARFWLKEKRREEAIPFFAKNRNSQPVRHISSVKACFVLTGITLLLLAVWRPQWGEDSQKAEKKGLDVVFAVDVSKSMKALDFAQTDQNISRLDATKYLIEQFAKDRKSDRLGLIEFAGESFVASPLTLDHDVFFNFLHNISSDDLGKQGTNLAEAIEVSLARLEVQAPEERGKAILLFSDGEETLSSDAEKMAKLAKDKGIKIFTVGVGSEQGMPIPDAQDAFGNIVYKQFQGETVISKLNPDPLKKIADVTDGEYFHAATIADLKELQNELDTLPKKLLSEDTQSPKKERYFFFALFGLLFFAMGMLMPQRNFFSKSYAL